MKKLLIAANSQSFTETVSEYLSHQFAVTVCHNGDDALQLIQDIRPDILAIDLMLSGIDGIGVLQTAQSLGICPRVIAFSTYITDYVVAALELLNVCCLIRLPCDCRRFVARVLDVADWKEREPDQESELRDILAVLGFRTNHAGCVVTAACVLQYIHGPHQVLSTQLYPVVAQALGGTDKQIERSMGRAVEAAWESRDERVWRLYFPAGKNGKVMKPTNAKFLSVIAECLSHGADTEIKRHIG